MFKKIFYQAIVAAILATIACLIYERIYRFAFEKDYSKLVNLGSLAGINLLACLVAGIGFWLFTKWFGRRAEAIFNFTFSILSFASIMAPLSISLPLSIDAPEFFPGLAIPMHFFPVLAWMTVTPLFRRSEPIA